MSKRRNFPSRLLPLALGVVLTSGFAVAQTATVQKIKDASALYLDQKPGEALARFEEIEKTDPNNPDVLSWIGFLRYQTGDPKGAIAPLEKAAAARPEDLEIANNLGNAYFKTNQYDKALAKYAVVSAAKPTMYEPHYNSGVIYLKRREYAKAITELKTAEIYAPKDPFVQNDLGMAYEATKDYGASAASLQRASDLRPEDKLFARNAGIALARAGRLAEARKYLESVGTDDSDVALTLADLYQRNGERAKALQAYKAAEKDSSGKASYWFNVAVLRSQTGDDNGAFAAYGRALDKNPNDVDALKNYGMMQFRRGQYKQAETTFDKLAGLVPTSTENKTNLAAAAIRAGDEDRAITIWRDLLHVKRDPAIRLDLADALYAKGDYKGAALQYRIALQTKGSAAAYNGLGLTYLLDSKLAQAEAAFRSAIKANSRSTPAYNNLALTLERANRKKEAIALLEKAAEIAPNDAEIAKNLRRMKGG